MPNDSVNKPNPTQTNLPPILGSDEGMVPPPPLGTTSTTTTTQNTSTTSTTSSRNPFKGNMKKVLLAVVGLVILSGSVIAGVTLTSQSQDFTFEAAEDTKVNGNNCINLDGSNPADVEQCFNNNDGKTFQACNQILENGQYGNCQIFTDPSDAQDYVHGCGQIDFFNPGSTTQAGEWIYIENGCAPTGEGTGGYCTANIAIEPHTSNFKVGDVGKFKLSGKTRASGGTLTLRGGWQVTSYDTNGTQLPEGTNVIEFTSGTGKSQSREFKVIRAGRAEIRVQVCSTRTNYLGEQYAYCGGGNSCFGKADLVVTATAQETAQCQNIKIYDTNWNQLAAADLPKLEVGDVIRIAVTGTASSGNFTQARFTVNGTLRNPVTTKKPNTQEFYDEYTIPAAVTNLTIEGELNHSTLGWK